MDEPANARPCHVFGPVPSRRLGRSLGVDPVPLKTCNWNCVYCQLGRSRPVTNERREWAPRDAILDDVRRAVRDGAGEIDWITFAGSGEPTLHTGLGYLVGAVKRLSGKPVAVITNGALLYLPEVRRDLLEADAVMPSVTAGSRELFRRIHRPHPDADFERFVEGLVLFRGEYAGSLRAEVMLLEGINDGEADLRDLAELLARVRPDRIDLVLPNRPPAETWARTATEEGVLRARAILGETVRVAHPVEDELDLSGCRDLTEAVLAIITRHPLSEAELARALDRRSPGEVARVLGELEREGRARAVERFGVRFWSASPSFYPDEEGSLRARPRNRRHGWDE